jgi:ABC-type enterochelin transport system permease subunit
MVLVKMLKRHDGSSIVVGVVVGLILFTLVSSVSTPLAQKLSSVNPAQVTNWRNDYFNPFILALIELLALEILGWLYVLVSGSNKKK